MHEPPSARVIRTAWEAEEVVADWLRYWGYVDAFVTGGGGPDSGVDVEAGRAVAQVKAEMRAIGRPVIQQVFGIAAHADKDPFVFALAGFTEGAVTWADAAGVALFEFDLAGVPQPVNRLANNLIARGPERRPDDHNRRLCRTPADLDQIVQHLLDEGGANARLRHVMVLGERALGDDLAAHLDRFMAKGITTADAKLSSARGESLNEFLANLLTQSHELCVIHRIEHLSDPYGDALRAAQQGSMQVILGDGANAFEATIDVPPFSLIGVTEQPGAVPRSIRDLFEWWIIGTNYVWD